MFWIGYIIINCFYNSTFLLGFTLLAKICNSKTRGTMFGFQGLLGSCGIAVLNAISERTFKSNNMVVFELGCGCYIFLFTVIIIFWLMGKLNS